MKTYMAKAEAVERKWYVVDADGFVHRQVALFGKHLFVGYFLKTAYITRVVSVKFVVELFTR